VSHGLRGPHNTRWALMCVREGTREPMARETASCVKLAMRSSSGEKEDAFSSKRYIDSNSTTCEILGPIASAVVEDCDRRRQGPSCASVASYSGGLDWSLLCCSEAKRTLGESTGEKGRAGRLSGERA